MRALRTPSTEGGPVPSKRLPWPSSHGDYASTRGQRIAERLGATASMQAGHTG